MLTHDHIQKQEIAKKTSLKNQTPDKNYMNDKNDEGKVCVYTITLTEVMK